MPPARSLAKVIVPDPERSWTSEMRTSLCAPVVVERTETLPDPVAARMMGLPAEESKLPPMFVDVLPLAEPWIRMLPLTVRNVLESAPLRQAWKS